MHRTVMGATAALVLIVAASACRGSGAEAGVVLVFAPRDPTSVEDLDAALDEAANVIARRIEDVSIDGNVARDGETIVVELAEIFADEAIEVLNRTALLEFCEPVTNQAGDVAVVTAGAARYERGSCGPVRDQAGEVVVDGGGVVEFMPWAPQNTAAAVNNPPLDLIVWQPATVEIEGREVTLDGRLLRQNTYVILHQVTSEPEIVFEWTSEGQDVSEAVTERLATRNYPLAPFLDGEPITGDDDSIIAPTVLTAIRAQGTITGLSFTEAQDLSKLLNIGAIPLQLVIEEIVEAE